jgi:hypothetical protein
MPLWSEEEIILAMEFYYTCPERMHTDAHAKCQEIAAQLERTPGALDRIIRNIKFVHTGGVGLEHASQRIHDLVNLYRNDLPGLRQRAAQIRADHDLPQLDCGA